MKRIKIRSVSLWSMIVAVVVGLLFFIVSSVGNSEFQVLETATEQCSLCEKAAKDLQDGSNYLTEQVRLYTMTGQRKYMDAYYEEATVNGRRESALEALRENFDGTNAFHALQTALKYSQALMNTEYYALRLVAEAEGERLAECPPEVQNTQLTDADQSLSAAEKLALAQQLVSDDAYQKSRTAIIDQVTACMDSLIQQTRNQLNRATDIFGDMYGKLEIGIVVLMLMMVVTCLVVHKLMIAPLLKCNECIRKGATFPVTGAAEVQMLAETYNQVYLENEEAQMLLRHKAEHDALTDLLNRASFDKLLKLHEDGDSHFALILVDVDSFKSVNDIYGHAEGDKVLKKVASLLLTMFRSIDYVCRIGGDEFAIIMVKMTSDLNYTIPGKIDAVNAALAKSEAGLPMVTVSAGAAFSDRAEPVGSIFEDADAALYQRKEHGKAGCAIFGT